MAREISATYTTGKTVTAKLYNLATGTLAQTVTLTEEATNWYTATFPSIAAATYQLNYFDGSNPIGEERLIWNGTSVVDGDTTDLTAIESQLNTIQGKTDLIGTAAATVSSPVTAEGNIELISGDDFKAADGRAIEFTLTNSPNLAGATVRLIADWVFDDKEAVNLVGTVTNPTNNPTVSFDIPASVTSTLRLNDPAYEFRVVATLSNGDVCSLVEGTLTVKD